MFEEEYYEDRTTSSNENDHSTPSAQVYWSFPIGHPATSLPNAPGTPPRAPSPPNNFEPPEVQSDEEPVLNQETSQSQFSEQTPQVSQLFRQQITTHMCNRQQKYASNVDIPTT